MLDAFISVINTGCVGAFVAAFSALISLFYLNCTACYVIFYLTSDMLGFEITDKEILPPVSYLKRSAAE